MEFCKFCLNVFGQTLRVSECNSKTGVSDAAFCRVTVLWRCNRLSLTLTLKQSTDQSVPKKGTKARAEVYWSTDRSTASTYWCASVRFGLWFRYWSTASVVLTLTLTWTLTLKRSTDRSTDRSTASVPKHGPKHMFLSILKQCFGINYSMPLNRGHRIVSTEALLRLSATEALLRYQSTASVVLLNRPINTTNVT